MSAPASTASRRSRSRETSTSTLCRWPDGLARALDRRRHAARERDVVVLDQHAVVEPEAVVARAAGRDRVLLKHAQARRSLARVNDLRVRALDGLDEAARERRDAGEALHQVQGEAFAREQHVGEAGRARDDLARLDLVAVGDEGF